MSGGPCSCDDGDSYENPGSGHDPKCPVHGKKPKPKVYLSGRIAGISREQACAWRTEFAEKHKNNLDVLDPMGRPFNEHGSMADAYQIVEGDCLDIDRSDAILVNYECPSAGTMMEIMHAFHIGRPVIVVNNSGARELSPWIRVHSTYIVDSFDSAAMLLRCVVPIDHCTAGFMFNKDLSEVALVRKSHPNWQKGKLNGVGGHIEEGETPAEAQVREFREEASRITSIHDWHRFLCMRGEGLKPWQVDFFCMRDEHDLNRNMLDLRITRDEPIEIHNTADIIGGRQNTIENLPWLIALAIDHLVDGRPLSATVKYL